MPLRAAAGVEIKESHAARLPLLLAIRSLPGLPGGFAGAGTPPSLARFESLSACFCVLACLLGEPFQFPKRFPAHLELRLGTFGLQSSGFGFDLGFRGFSQKILHTLWSGAFCCFEFLGFMNSASDLAGTTADRLPTLKAGRRREATNARMDAGPPQWQGCHCDVSVRTNAGRQSLR